MKTLDDACARIQRDYPDLAMTFAEFDALDDVEREAALELRVFLGERASVIAYKRDLHAARAEARAMRVDPRTMRVEARLGDRVERFAEDHGEDILAVACGVVGALAALGLAALAFAAVAWGAIL